MATQEPNPNAADGPPREGLVTYKGNLWRDPDTAKWYNADGSYGGRIGIRELNAIERQEREERKHGAPD